jgi:hypothetical protein
MKKWYRIAKRRNLYCAVIIVSETEKTITVRLKEPRGTRWTERENKVSSTALWVETEQEALDWLRDKLSRDLVNAQARVEDAESQLAWFAAGKCEDKNGRWI